jgi:hypothetical protein
MYYIETLILTYLRGDASVSCVMEVRFVILD